MPHDNDNSAILAPIWRNLRGFLAEVAEHPIGIFWLGVVVLVVSSNAVGGYELGGNSLLLAAVFVCVAMVGIWSGEERRRRTGAARAALTFVVAVQLILGQWSGWMAMGLIMSRGEGALAAKATAQGTLADRIKSLREERARLGAVETVDAAAARRDAECVRTGKRCPFDDAKRCAEWLEKFGDGPQCKAQKAKLAEAERAVKIDTELLPAALAQQGKGETLVDADAGYRVPLAVASAVSAMFGGGGKWEPSHIRFGLEMFVVFVLELIATIGKPLFGIGAGSRAGSRHGAASGRRHDDRSDRGAAGVARHDDASGFDIAGLPRVRRLPAPVRRVALPAQRIEIGERDPSPQPLNINVSVAGPAAARATATDADVVEVPPRSAPVAPAAATPPKPRAARPEVGAVASAPPADRSAVNEALDGLLAFRAACVSDRPGALVTAEQMWRRYAAWRGTGAVAEAAFHALFPDATGLALVDVAGARHYRDATLRAPAIAAVG